MVSRLRLLKIVSYVWIWLNMITVELEWRSNRMILSPIPGLWDLYVYIVSSPLVLQSIIWKPPNVSHPDCLSFFWQVYNLERYFSNTNNMGITDYWDDINWMIWHVHGWNVSWLWLVSGFNHQKNMWKTQSTNNKNTPQVCADGIVPKGSWLFCPG